MKVAGCDRCTLKCRCGPRRPVALWGEVPAGVLIKHVEPLGELGDAGRLLETQARLIARFGATRVTVLATGVLALPFRAVLARRNALDLLRARRDLGRGARATVGG